MLMNRDPLLNEIAKLRDRLSYLEEENRQLREALEPAVALPVDWKLTKTEARVLLALHRVRQGYMDRERLLVALYGLEVDVEPKIIDVMICKLRKKLRVAGAVIPIRTFHGDGFGLTREGHAALAAVLAVAGAEGLRVAA